MSFFFAWWQKYTWSVLHSWKSQQTQGERSWPAPYGMSSRRSHSPKWEEECSALLMWCPSAWGACEYSWWHTSPSTRCLRSPRPCRRMKVQWCKWDLYILLNRCVIRIKVEERWPSCCMTVCVSPGQLTVLARPGTRLNLSLHPGQAHPPLSV